MRGDQREPEEGWSFTIPVGHSRTQSCPHSLTHTGIQPTTCPPPWEGKATVNPLCAGEFSMWPQVPTVVHGDGEYSTEGSSFLQKSILRYTITSTGSNIVRTLRKCNDSINLP